MGLYLLLTIIPLLSSVVARNCSRKDELPCLTSNDCIHKSQWCDQKYDCGDGSDEYFCQADSCPESLFRCNNGKCIPESAKCDGFNNCGDGSDELCQGATGNLQTLPPSIRLEEVFSDAEIYPPVRYIDELSPGATTKAAQYVLKKQMDDGWHDFLPRAVVALAFAERAGSIPGELISPLKKELNIKILINLYKQNGRKPKLCDLSYYINALYGTCQDPRNFQGIDLVRLLRSEVDIPKKEVSPLAFLSLCIAQETSNDDIQRLLVMYDTMGSDRLGSKALIMMALACISNSKQVVPRGMQRKFQEFIRKARSDFDTVDIYTKILYLQAFNALNYKTEIDLSAYQLPDGSFGDLLATYYAIPALLNGSLLDLKEVKKKCERSSNYEATRRAIQLPMRNSKRKKVTYSLWIDKDTYVDTHSLVVSVEGNKTFYDVMKMAEGQNPFFRFMPDPSNEGIQVYSLAGIPNDSETGKEWTLYRGKENGVIFHSKEHLARQNKGVDRIFPNTGEHFVFLYERSVR